MQFTERDMSTIRAGMEVAAEEYRKLSNQPSMNNRLARQFNDQAEDAEKIVERILAEGY
jgi:hypothetical protein